MANAAAKKKPLVAGASSNEVKHPVKGGKNWFAKNPKLSAALFALLAICIGLFVTHDNVGKPIVLPIERVHVSRMTPERFLAEYAEQKPVVLAGAWAALGWSPREIADACPAAQIRTHRFSKSSDRWANHEKVGARVNLQEFVATSYSDDYAKRPDPVLYGFEFELTKHCPVMLEKFVMPGFLAGDALHLATNGTGIGWPSVLLGPSGSETGLHIDTHRTPFWIATVGAENVPLKRWRIFPPDDAKLLKFHRPGPNTHWVPDFDPWAPDSRLTGHKLYEGDLVAGDLLYVPGGSPHAAKNVNDNTGISLNFLDLKALPAFAKKCTKNSPLCGLVAGKGAWMIDVLGERQRRQEPMTYYEFAGHADKIEFCTAHAVTKMDDGTRPPALETYCSQS